MKIKQIEKSGRQAIIKLRKNKLNLGQPFMINTKDLPSSQFYLEHPDGHIEHTTITSDKTDFKTITKFTLKQSDLIIKKYKLI